MSAGQGQRVAAVRRFNRFYTRQIGVLRRNYLDSPYSLGEMRVLYELAQTDKLGGARTATDIGRALDLDPGYLSRVLRAFEKRGLISRKTSENDARQSHLTLTTRGEKLFAPFERRSQAQVGGMLRKLASAEQARLVAAMTTIENLLGGAQPAEKPGFILRAPKPGDFGWVVTRHAQLYRQEYGWGAPFEGLCAQIVANFDNRSSGTATTPTFGSIVQNGKLAAWALAFATTALKRVDLPTFGKPTLPALNIMVGVRRESPQE